jgi:hypothetical protein
MEIKEIWFGGRTLILGRNQISEVESVSEELMMKRR